MLTGSDLGLAIEQARVKKGVKKSEMAKHFGVSPPSVQDWVNRGTIDKARLGRLYAYFADVVGPEHWGLQSFTDLTSLSTGVDTYPVAQDSSYTVLHSLSTPSQRLPVGGTLVMGEHNMYEIRHAEGSSLGAVNTFHRSRSQICLQIFGDHLYPALRHGTCLILEPAVAPQPGELAALEDHSGRFMICEVVSISSDSVTFSPATGGTRSTKDMSEFKRVLSIVATCPGSAVIRE